MVALCLRSAFFEAVADSQLNAFVKTKTGKSEILTSGLWRYSRHPNYFGEVTTWWGLWIVAIAPALADPTSANLAIALIGLISPVTIIIFILKVSGIPMLEAKYVDNEDFEAYKQRTSAFFPWFPEPAKPSARATPQPDLAGLALGLLLLQGIDQFDGREEADFSAMMLDGLDAQGCGGMGLAGARAADQHDILGAVEKLAFVQLPQRGLVDLTYRKIESGEVLASRGEEGQQTVRGTVCPTNAAFM